jgi:hypothetical protein
VQHFVIAELRGPDHFGLEGVAHKILRPLSGDHHLAAGIGRHVHLEMIGLERETRVRHLERHPPALHADRAQFFHLGVVELRSVGRELLRGIRILVGLFRHHRQLPRKAAGAQKDSAWAAADFHAF